MSEQQGETEYEWITSKEAAEIMGIDPASVAHLCKTGGIICRRFGGKIWQIRKDTAESYVKTKGGRGKKVKKVKKDKG